MYPHIYHFWWSSFFCVNPATIIFILDGLLTLIVTQVYSWWIFQLLCDKVWISPSPSYSIKNIFLWVQNFTLRWLKFTTLKMSLHFLMVCIVHHQKAVVILIVSHYVCIYCVCFLWLFKMFFLSLVCICCMWGGVDVCLFYGAA